MKKILSLALALALCLGLTLPALAANQPGDTTVTDSQGNVYTLSSPILYTLSKEQLGQLQFTDDYIRYGFDGEGHDPEGSALYNVTKAYAVPVGTTITAPPSVTTKTQGAVTTVNFGFDVQALSVGQSGSSYAIQCEEYLCPYAEQFDLDGQEYGYQNAFWVLTCYKASSTELDSSSGGAEGSSSEPIDAIAFFTSAYEELQTGFPGLSASEDTTAPSKTAFSDVQSTAYYADSVAWAVEQGITNGTSATTFSPDQTCTTAQILTFLWRAKGSPEPSTTANPFTDVKSSDYYYKAAVWAKESGLVSGSAFQGDTPCTRSMVVAYLWQLAGKPAANTNRFTDVSATAEYAQAVAWAVDEDVTSGTSATTFSPDLICTRGQIVTFLYRAFT